MYKKRHSKKYLPMVGKWEGSKDFPVKRQEPSHLDCKFFNPITLKCDRRNVRPARKTDLHCKFFKSKKGQYKNISGKF